MRDTCIEELTILAESDRDVILITGDLGFGVLDNFRKKFPKQFLNAGVAEQNMTTVAAGMAIEGKKVFTYSIGNFPTLRCLEQIRVDICYHDLNVTVVSIGGGFSYGSLGMTHHATEDLSIMRALPNMKVISPSTLKEVRGAVKALYEQEGPSYLRLDKSDAKVDGEENKYQFGKASRIRDGEAITLIACGSVLEECIEASNILSKEKIECRILSMHTVKPLDFQSIKEATEETGGIITVEENTILGGLGGAVAESCVENKSFPSLFKRIGLKDTFSTVVGDQKYLRDHYNINSETIVKIVKESSSKTSKKNGF